MPRQKPHAKTPAAHHVPPAPSPAAAPEPPAPYVSVLEHLSDHLARLGAIFAAHLLRSPERSRQRTREELIAHIQRISADDPPPESQEYLRLADARLVAIRAREAVTTIDLPLARLSRTFGLSQTEQDVLLLASASSLDPRFAHNWNEIDTDLLDPEVGMAISLFARDFAEGVAMRRLFTTTATLVVNSIVLASESCRTHDGNMLGLGLSVPRRIVSELLGHSDLDEELVAFSMVRRSKVSLDQVVLPEATKSLVLDMVKNHPRFLARRREWGIDDVVTYGRGMVLLFVGRPGTGKTMLANAIAHELDKRLFCVDMGKLLNRSRSFEANLDAVFREARLLDAVIFFDECEQVFASRRFGNEHMPVLLTRLESFDGIAVLATNMAGVLDEALMRRTVACVEFKPPTPSERAEIWRRHLPAGLPLAPDVDLQRIADDFELTGGYIKNAVLTAVMRSTARGADGVSMEDLVHGARLQVRLPIDDGEETDRVVRPEARLDDVVLPGEVRRRVDEFVAAAKVRPTVLSEWGFGRTLGRGTGLAAMISGPAGTGKSMTAEAIATALERPLLRCLLTAVISKYVGDTAKNVAALFERAKAQHAVLLFEEADALFARRVEVRTANDRFANAESAALLTQMEAHAGIVLLTTNLEVAIDPAFERRLQMRITLPAPDARARAAIWRKLLPSEAPVAPDVDFANLARRYDLSGGLIRNAVQAAALQAASALAGQRIITRAMLDRAAAEQAAHTQPETPPAWAVGEA